MSRKNSLPLIEDFNSIPEQALVPEAEQPYLIPEHWKWVRLGCVATTSKEKVDFFSDGQCYIGLNNLEIGGGISNFSDARELKSVKSVFTSGNILYGKLRPYLDKHAVVNFDGVCSTDILVYIPTVGLDARYFDFWLSTSTFRNAAVNKAKGINLPRVSEATLSRFPFPLPPLEEQEEIVEKLTDRLEKIDAAIARLQTFLEGSESRTESVLEAAVHGRLTEDWRVNLEHRE